MNDVYKNIDEFNLAIIIFDDMVADNISNKSPNPITTELFIRGRKLDIQLF